MLNNKIYQTIYDEICGFLPDSWDKLVVYLEYGEASYSMAFYVKEQSKYIKCFDLPGITDDELMSAFSRIDKAVMKERRQEKGELWTNMTMLLTPDGNMHTDFDYTDLSENAYQYSKDWKKKYLI